MSIREQTQRVFRHGGDAEFGSSIALPPLFSPEGSANMRVRNDGLLEAIEGYSSLNTATTTDTGADAAKVTGIAQYRTITTGAITREWLKVVDDGTDEVEIWKSTDDGASWSFLKDLGSSYVGLRPYFAQYGDTMVIVFGEGLDVTPQAYDGSTVSDAGQTQPSAPTAATSSTEGLLNGRYRYKVAIIDADGDIGPASAATDPLVVEDTRVDLSSIPTGSGSPKGRRIFRTFGDGEVYFRLADIDDNTTTTFEDNISDEELADRGALIDDIGDPPPDSSKLVVHHRNRLFFKTDDNEISYSDADRPESVGENNFELVGKGADGDEIVGLTPEYEGELVIWKQRRVWRLAGASRRTFNMVPTQASIGAISGRVVQRVPESARFVDQAGQLQAVGRPSLAYMAPDQSIRIFDGFSDTIISSAKQDTLDGMSYANRAEAVAFRYDPYGWIVWGFPSSGSSIVDTFVAWDFKRGAWHDIDFLPNIACVAVGDTSSDNNYVVAGEAETSTGGLVYRLLNGSDADGSNITWKVRTKALDFESPELVKVLTELQPVFEAQGSSFTVTINFYEGFADTGASSFSSHTVDIQGSNVNLVSPDPIYPKDTNGAYPRGQAIVVEYTVTGQTRWALAGWSTRYQVEQPARVAS